MSYSYDLLDTFAQHETIVFTVTCRTRAGALLASPESATVTMVVCSDEDRETKLFEMVGSPQVIHLGASVFQLKPSDANAALLLPKTVYWYDVWSQDGTNGRLRQVDGKIRLEPARKEA